MTERYSTFSLAIKALSNLSTTYSESDAEVWDVIGRQEMNAAGRGSFRLYASNATLFSNLKSNIGQVVTVYVSDQVASGSNMDLATFIIKSITTEINEADGVSIVTVSGPEITDQLRNKHARNNAIDNGSGGPSTTDITDIMGYAPAGWSLTNNTATTNGTYHAARGDTVMKLLNAAAMQSGEIFRLDEYVNPTSKGLFWAASPDSSGVTLRMPTTHSQYNASTTVGKLHSLRRDFDFEPVITRIRPFGAGVGDGRLDITNIDSGDTGADPSWLDTDFANNWLINTDLETALGYEIEADIDFSWIQANDPTNATELTTAAVALWKTAKNFLEQNDSTRKFYTAPCNVAANLRPGQNITVVYGEYEGGPSGGSQTISDNDTFTILAVENRFEEGERITTLTLGDKPLPWPTAAQWVADVAEKTQDTTRKSDVGTSPGAVSSGRMLNATLPLRIDGGGAADLSADRTLALDGLSSYGAANQLPGANAAATGWEYKSIVEGDNVSIVHGVGAITIAADVGTGDLHSPVALAADADSVLGLSGQQLTLDSQGANLVFAGPTGGGAADPTFRSLVDADIPSSIARDSELHPAVSIAPSVSSVFDIGAGQVLGMDNQLANTFLAGPSTGPATTPAFRTMVDADIPASIARDSELHNQVHGIVGSDHTVSGNALDVVGLSGTNTLAVLTPSASVTSATSALLRTDSNGRTRVQGIGLGAAASANNWAIVGSGGGVGLSNSGAGRLAFTNTTVDTAVFSDCYVGFNGTTPEAFIHIDSISTDPPCILVNAGTNGEMATDDGAQIRIGHWSGAAFTERWHMYTAGEWQAVNSNVAHGITTYAETNVFGSLELVEGNSGGLNVIGYKDADGVNNRALTLTGRLGEAADTTKSSSGRGVVEIAAQVKSGTGVAAVGSNGNLLSVNTAGATRWIVDTEGDTHRDGSDNTYDDWEDAHLARAFDRAVSPNSVIDSEFDQWVQYGRTELIEAGILHESGFYNESRLLRLAVGGLWQEYTKRKRLEARVNELEQRLLN